MRDETIIDAEHDGFRPRRRKLWAGLILCIVLLLAIYAWVIPGDPDTAEPTDSERHAAFLKKRATFEETKQLADKRNAHAPAAAEDAPVSVQNVLDAVKEMAPAAPPAPSTREKELLQEVEALKAELAAAQDAHSTDMSAPADAAPADAVLIAQLQQAVLAMGKEVAALKVEMDAMRKAAPQDSLFVDFYLLEREAQAGNPFTNEYDALMQRDDLPEAARALLSELADKREGGIPTREQIENAFHDTLQRYFTGQAVPAKDAGLWQRIRQNLKGLVVIRKVGAEQEGMDPAAILARAEAAIEQHDITIAEQEVRTLPKPTRELFADWLQMVEDRVEPLTRLEEARMILLAPPSEDAPRTSDTTPEASTPEAAPQTPQPEEPASQEPVTPKPDMDEPAAEEKKEREELRSPTPEEPLPPMDEVSQPL